MQALIMDGPGAIRLGDWRAPRPGPDEVVVEVAATGVCAGDMYIFQGKNPYATYPQVCGHEIAGRVAEIGAAVTAHRVGDTVVVEPFIGCGVCYPCRHGRGNCCVRLQIIGVQRAGGFAERVLVPAANVHRAPPNLTMVQASFAEPVAVAVQACRRGAVAAGDDVLVLGCGPIGLALIEVARARGARVIATDTVPARRAVAEQLGAATVPAGSDLPEAVGALTGGDGAAVVIEATGNERAMSQTVDLVVASGRVVIVGLVKEGQDVPFRGLEFTRKELTLVGSRASLDCFPEALRLLAEGRVTYPRLATAFAMGEGPRVIRAMAADPAFAHKAVLVREPWSGERG